MKIDSKMIGIIALFLISGSINMLALKWANTISSVGNDGQEMLFQTSFLQVWGMFLGQSLCMVAFLIYKLYRRRMLSDNVDQAIVKPAADVLDNGDQAVDKPAADVWEKHKLICSIILLAIGNDFATWLMYFGLTRFSDSCFQMLGGSVIIFTAALSHIILGNRIGWVRVVGILFVILGLVTVALMDENPVGMKIGFIAITAFFVALQVVCEEKFIRRFQMMPLEVIGWQGIFCLCGMSIILVHASVTSGHSLSVREDALNGFTQIWNSPLLAFAFFLGVVSTAVFNFAGITITKLVSATHRKVLDTVPIVIIWTFSMAVKGQEFAWLHLIGFFVVILGVLIYNRG